jgi:hypothetical protein
MLFEIRGFSKETTSFGSGFIVMEPPLLEMKKSYHSDGGKANIPP